MYSQLVGPLEENESFSVQDYAMLVQLENSSYAHSVAEAVGDVAVEGVSPDEDTSAFRSRLALKVSSLLHSQPQQRRLPLPSLKNQHRSTTSQKSLPLSCTGVILQEEFFSFIYRAYIFNSDNFCPFTVQWDPPAGSRDCPPPDHCHPGPPGPQHAEVGPSPQGSAGSDSLRHLHLSQPTKQALRGPHQKVLYHYT